MISLRQVSKDYVITPTYTFNALKNITLEVAEGEFISLVGPSGCGKSTLMHIIGLLEKPTTGDIRIFGKDTATLSDNELSYRRNADIGFVFQQFNLINKMTIAENVLLPASYSQEKTNENYYAKAMDLLKRFGIADKAGSFPNRISGGQQQRTAIARALIMSPKIILADEPTGNLDSNTGKEILDLLVELNKEKITVIIVTHDAAIAKRARRVLRMKDGALV